MLKDPQLGQGFHIEALKTTKDGGFIACGKKGEIKFFERKDAEPQNPYVYLATLPSEDSNKLSPNMRDQMMMDELRKSFILSVDFNADDTMLVFTNDQS